MTGEFNINQTSLVALYHLEGVNDATAGGFNLTNTNTVAFNPGKFTNSADFSPTNSDKDLRIGNNLGITDNIFTVMCWVKRHAEIGSGTEAIFSHINSTTDSTFAMAYEYNSGTPRINHYFNIQGGAESNNYTNFPLGNLWHHLAITSDGTILKGYIDGFLVSLNGSAVGTGSGITTDGLTIGAFTSNPYPTVSLYWSGMIDEFAVFHREVPSNEIRNYYTWALGRRSFIS